MLLSKPLVLGVQIEESKDIQSLKLKLKTAVCSRQDQAGTTFPLHPVCSAQSPILFQKIYVGIFGLMMSEPLARHKCFLRWQGFLFLNQDSRRKWEKVVGGWGNQGRTPKPATCCSPSVRLLWTFQLQQCLVNKHIHFTPVCPFTSVYILNLRAFIVELKAEGGTPCPTRQLKAWLKYFGFKSTL